MRSIRVGLWITLLLAAIAFVSTPSSAVTSCVASTASATQSQGCSLAVTSGDKVLMAVMTPSASFCQNNTGSSVSTLTCQIAVHSGDTVILWSANGVQTPTFSSTTPSETWTQHYNQQRQATGKYIAEADATAGSAGTMTCSVNQGSSFAFWEMGCYDVGPLGAIDVESSATGGSSTATTSVTTTQANDQLIVINAQQGGGHYTVDTGYLVERFDPSNCGCAIADKLAGASGSYSETNSLSSTSWATMLIAYKTTTTPVKNLPTFSSASPSLSWTLELSKDGIGNSGNNADPYQISLSDAVANSSGTMTCTADVGAPIAFWAVFCYDGGPLGAIDASNSATGTSGTPTTSVTSTQPNDLYFWFSTVTGGAYGVSTGYTTRQSELSNSAGLIADQIFAATGSHSATASITSTGWTIGLIAYLPASAGTRHRSVLF